MLSLKEVRERFCPQIADAASFKAWLQSDEPRPAPYFPDRTITTRTITSSKLFGWDRGVQVIKALKQLVDANIQTMDLSLQASILLDMLKPGEGVDLTDDPSAPARIATALHQVGLDLTQDEVNKLADYGITHAPKYQRYAPNGVMPSDEEIATAF